MIDSSGGVPPGGGSGSSGGVPPGGGSGPEPPQGPPPTGFSSSDQPAPMGKAHPFFNTKVMFDSKQYRMFNMLLYQQFKSVMQPLWTNARKALKRLGKNDPYAS